MQSHSVSHCDTRQLVLLWKNVFFFFNLLYRFTSFASSLFHKIASTFHKHETNNYSVTDDVLCWWAIIRSPCIRWSHISAHFISEPMPERKLAGETNKRGKQNLWALIFLYPAVTITQGCFWHLILLQSLGNGQLDVKSKLKLHK